MVSTVANKLHRIFFGGFLMARPRQALLTREKIVEAASALVDAEGLDALSTRRKPVG